MRSIWLYAKQGQIYLNAEWKPGQIHSGDVSICIEPEGSDFEVVIYKTYSIGTPRLSCPDFEQCCAEKCADFADWCRKMKAHSDIDREMAFVLWQSIVAPLGNYKEETILCNKEGLNAVWSWDNCFHALGVAKAFPALAFYQLQLVYDNLDAEGAMPDAICPFGVERGFTKPPVHAFIYAILMKMHPYFFEQVQIERIYPAMRRNFFWWLHGRQNAPIYWHGNESGADNATCFDRYPHIQSPDLYAMLSCTADLLSTFAETLDDSTSAASYHAHAVQLAEEAEARFYDGKQFFVRPMDDGSAYYGKPAAAAGAGREVPHARLQKADSLPAPLRFPWRVWADKRSVCQREAPRRTARSILARICMELSAGHSGAGS